MIQVLGENYFIDLDEIENYLDMSESDDSSDSESENEEAKEVIEGLLSQTDLMKHFEEYLRHLRSLRHTYIRY